MAARHHLSGRWLMSMPPAAQIEYARPRTASAAQMLLAHIDLIRGQRDGAFN
jgi:hypothetical protein